MDGILVSGLINIETTLQVDSFPIEYNPVRFPFFGVNSGVSGVGFNIAKALATLGNRVDLLSMVGKDFNGKVAVETLASAGIPVSYILSSLEHTPQSVILYEPSGRREINVDLKDIQGKQYPEELFEQALSSCALAALCNINFSRPFLQKARQAGKRVATDVHTISSLDDEYNRDFMAAADILFMSNELLPTPPEDWARRVLNRFGAEIIVIGLGPRGLVLAVRSEGVVERIPAVYTRPIVSTIGAGDALFSCFLHAYQKTGDPHAAIRKAVVFASYKIGEPGAADGFLDEQGLEQAYNQVVQHWQG